MTALQAMFRDCRKVNRAALIPYFTCGYPDKRTFKSLLHMCGEIGIDALEIGIPFSDPLADGPAIQYSSQHALAAGENISTALEYASTAVNNIRTRIIFMSYINPILAYGPEKFVRDASRCNVAGLIVPDLIPEEGRGLEKLCAGRGIDLVYLLSPQSNGDRRKIIMRRTSGFLYLVSVTGITGVRKSLPAGLIQYVARAKKESARPVCVGFGISTPAQAGAVGKIADGVIVGSAIIELIRKSASANDAVKSVRRLLTAMQKELSHD